MRRTPRSDHQYKHVLEKELELAAFDNRAQPCKWTVPSDVRRLRTVDKLNDDEQATEGTNSLAQQAVLAMAQADLARNAALQASLTQMEQARTEASRQCAI